MQADKTESSTSTRPVFAESKQAVDRWFEFSVNFWDAKFTSKFDSVEQLDSAKRDWFNTLEKHRISIADVERVILITQADKTIWPLSLPEFLRACEPVPTDFGYPSVDQIWKQLINPYAHDDWTKVHLFAFFIACGKDPNLHHSEIVAAGRCSPDTKRYKAKFHAVERVYLWYVRRAINGCNFNDPRSKPVARLGVCDDAHRQKNLSKIEELREKFPFLKAS
ncbi:hypothetical protein [Catenovulum sediminis]|uniref:Uncharacterized protein n=1 Tax=Catenovulum sediminis TaxID=1740262 RepID=A0ABV1RKB8_9ALTE